MNLTTQLSFARPPKAATILVALLSMLINVSVGRADEASGGKDANANGQETGADNSEPEKRLFSGKVVRVRDALEERGIKVADEMKDQVALETASGDLIPIAADWRGRAFYQDEKLRNRKVEIVGYRREGIPWLHALIIYFFNDEGQRVVFDYWCDICSIPMYEIKKCECCQGPIRHRYRPAELPDFLAWDSRTEGEDRKTEAGKKAGNGAAGKKAGNGAPGKKAGNGAPGKKAGNGAAGKKAGDGAAGKKSTP